MPPPAAVAKVAMFMPPSRFPFPDRPRLWGVALLNRAMCAELSWRQLALTPLLDVLMLYAWCVPFFPNRITWRGYQARIGRDTEMIAA